MLRNLFFTFGICILLANCGGSNTSVLKEESNKVNKKNVLILVGDDHAPGVLGAAGNTIIKTPNLDRLASSGTYFSNAYSNAPICSASRQSMLTGKYPIKTGVNLLFTPFPDEGNETLAEYLKGYGYRTAIIGKNHFNNWVWSKIYQDGEPHHGFDTIITGNQHASWLKDHPQPPIPESQLTYPQSFSPRWAANKWNGMNVPGDCWDSYCANTFYAKQTVKFMTRESEEPFCIWVGFNQAHSPFRYPIEYKDKYNTAEVPLPEPGPEDLKYMPAIYAELTEAERRGIITAYYTSLEFLDKNVGIVLDALDSLELMNNTIVVYVGDHGYLLNDHGRFEKHMFWEESVKSPLIIWPGKKPEISGKVSALIEFVDIIPTVYDAMNLPIPEVVDGISYLPVITGDSTALRDTVFSTYLVDNKAMLATSEWKYIFSSGIADYKLNYETGKGPSGIAHRLYNLHSDPKEHRNLANDPEYADILGRFRNQLLRKFKMTHPEGNKVPKDLTLDGQLAWFCIPRDLGAEPGVLPLRMFYKEKMR